jgi:hypothetical protein
LSDAKGNKANLMDRVLALTSVKEASVEFAAAAAERVTVAYVVPVDQDRASAMNGRVRCHPPRHVWPPMRPSIPLL